jgi:hypothetical protein
MDNREHQVQAILRRIDRIQEELIQVRQLIMQLADTTEGTSQEPIVVEAELVSALEPAAVVASPPVPLAAHSSGLSKRQIRQDGRWRAQNWAIRERELQQQEAVEKESVDHAQGVARR